MTPAETSAGGTDVQAERTGAVFYPHYWSTYCIHDRHDECRLTCKTCKAPCLCTCHQSGKGEMC